MKICSEIDLYTNFELLNQLESKYEGFKVD